MMTERIFYLDIAALVILVIALLSQLTRRMTKGKSFISDPCIGNTAELQS